tara:strand:- start:909 stop:1040 length:132 start_codon:yes stop_codon:yes gene_type:complete
MAMILHASVVKLVLMQYLLTVDDVMNQEDLVLEREKAREGQRR